MRVGVILRYLWIAGAPKIAIYQVKGLIEQNHRAKLIILAVSPRYKGEYDHLLHEVPHTFIQIPKSIEIFELILNNILFGKWRPRERVIPLTSIILTMRQVVGYDVLICHDPLSGFIGLIAKTFFNIPYIVYLHETPFGKRIFTPIERIVLNRADIVLTVTDKVAKDASRVIRRKVVALPPGLPINQQKFKLKGDYVLTAARWDATRKPDWLIDVARRNKHKRFLVLGYWQSEELYNEFLTRVHGLNNIILYPHTVEEDVLNKLLKSSLAVIRLNPGEHGIATIVWEAVHKGVPVVVNSDLGVAEYIETFNAGVVVDRLDGETIGKALAKIERDYDVYVKNCIKLANYYSIKNHTKQILFFIKNFSKA